MPQYKILLIEDDADTRNLVGEILRPQKDLAVTGVRDAEAALQEIKASGQPFDMLIVDIKLPGMSGIDLGIQLRKDRKFKDVPMLYLTGLDNKDELEPSVLLSIADDFIKKPIKPQILEARITALLRRTLTANAPRFSLQKGPFTLYLAAKTLKIKNRQVPLTPREFEIMLLLMRMEPGIISREQIAAAVWADEPPAKMSNVDKAIERLRVKLGPDYTRHVVTHRGLGYQFLSKLD